VFLKNHGVYLINTVDPAIVSVCVCVWVFIRLSRFYISTFHGSRLFLEGGGCRFKAIIVALILGFVCIYALNRGHIFPSLFLLVLGRLIPLPRINIYPIKFFFNPRGISFPGYSYTHFNDLYLIFS